MFYKKPDDDKILLNHGAPSLPFIPRRFKLCVWNLHKCTHPLWDADFLDLAKTTDLFLTQEIMLKPSVKKTLESSGLYWTTAVSFLSPAKHYPAGVATGCKAEPQEVIYKNTIKEPLLKTPKVTLATLFKTKESELLVINVHAINFTGMKSFQKNIEQARNIILAFRGPIIIAGDFNTWNIKRLAAIKQLASHMNLNETLLYPDLRTKYFRKPVDYIFTRGLKLLCAHAINLKSSDHNPLCAEFEII